MKFHNLGAQNRFIQCKCGMSYKGHPSEVDKMITRHFKYCKLNNGKIVKFSEFRKDDGKINGINATEGNNKRNVVEVLSNGNHSTKIINMNELSNALTD